MKMTLIGALVAAGRGCLALLLLAVTPSMQAAELGSADVPLQPPFVFQSSDFFATLDFSMSIGGYEVFSTERLVFLDPLAVPNFLPSSLLANAGNTASFSSIAGLLTNGTNDPIQFHSVLWLGSNGFQIFQSTSEFALFGHDFAGSTISDMQLNIATPVSSTGGFFAVFQTSTLVVDGMTAAVPEPETYAMLLAGLGLVGFAARRKRMGRVGFEPTTKGL